MGSKVIALILVAGFTASGLLAIRQARIATAHDMAVLHRELVRRRQDVQALHVMIQEQLETDRLRSLIHAFEADAGTPMVTFRREECLLRCLPGVHVAFVMPEHPRRTTPDGEPPSLFE